MDFKLSFVILSSLLAFTVSASDGDQIDTDEKVVFFPSYGYFNSSQNKWVLMIQGHIFEPSTSRAVRRTVKSGFESYTGSKVRNEDEFWDRIRPLVSDNEGGERIKIHLGGKTYIMPASSPGGRFTGVIWLANSEAQALMDADGWIAYKATSEDNRTFSGFVQLTEPNGISVISDIDDTIKITEVYKNKKTMLVNTFNLQMKAAPGMADLYRKLNNSVTSFHYLSGSPWQLFPILDKFRVDNDFPAGSFNMKEFRVNPGSAEFWKFVASESTQEIKQDTIRDIMSSYPDRKFILVGDSGEHDPEIYGWAAGAYPHQVKEIYIRNVTHEEFDNQRMKNAFGSAIDKVGFIDMTDGSIKKFSDI